MADTERVEIKGMTNLEKMAKATGKELEQILNSHDYCKNENNCVHKLGDDECIECIEKWLKEEAKE